MKDYNSIPEDKLGAESSIKIERLDTEEDVYYELAYEIFDEIRKNNVSGKNSVFIFPVGPIAHYRKLARLIGKHRLDMKNVFIFNMDEYLDGSGNYIPKTHPLSFRTCMEREFYDRLGEYSVPGSHRYFPEPGNESFIMERIHQLGGVDMCVGGVGINGHIAFNEPPEPGEEISDEEYRQLTTRVLKISRETRTINAVGAYKGCIELMPEWCITIGMKEILSSKKIRISMPREWNCGMLRRIVHGPVSCKAPCSFLQEHPEVKIYITSAVAQVPVPNLQLYNR